MKEMNPILIACLLSLLAGLGTGLGGLIAVLRKPGRRSFGFLMGITAGVMITLSFHQLVNEAWELQGFVTATVGFAAGALFMLAGNDAFRTGVTARFNLARVSDFGVQIGVDRSCEETFYGGGVDLR